MVSLWANRGIGYRGHYLPRAFRPGFFVLLCVLLHRRRDGLVALDGLPGKFGRGQIVGAMVAGNHAGFTPSSIPASMTSYPMASSRVSASCAVIMSCLTACTTCAADRRRTVIARSMSHIFR